MSASQAATTHCSPMLCCALIKPDTARPALCTLSTLDTCTCHLTLNRSAACDKRGDSIHFCI